MLLILSVLSVISCAYGQVDGSFWWLTNSTSQPRVDAGHRIATTTITATTTIGETKEEAWCTCVPWYLCNTDNNTIITDGTGIIDIRASTSNVEVCPVNDGAKKEICCGSRPTPSSPSVRPSLTGVNPPTVWCECIPERLCNNGVINTDGAGILDPRIGNRNITVNVKFCPATVGEAEICCGLPPSELTTTEQNTTEQTTTQHTTTEQTTLSPVSSTVKNTEEVTHPSKVTYGHILSTPGSHTGMENAASYISSFFLLLILLLITHFFVI